METVNGTLHNATDLDDQRDPVTAAIFGVLAIVGIFGNSLVVYIVIRFSDMHSVTNTYISNLAKSDICFLLACAVPATVTLVHGGVWTLGDFMCRFIVYMQSVSVQATCGTLTIMTMDRCAVIFNPLKARARRTKKIVYVSIGIIWLTSFLLHLPVVMFYGVMIEPTTRSPTCTYFFDKPIKLTIYTVYEVLVMYAVPLTIIVACNVGIAAKICTRKLPGRLRKTFGRTTSVALDGRNGKPSAEKAKGRARFNSDREPANQKVRVTVMVMMIVVFFAVCWGPVHVIRIYLIINSDNYSPLVLKLSNYALCLTYFNSAMNPVLYAFLGKNYRAHAKQLFC